MSTILSRLKRLIKERQTSSSVKKENVYWASAVEFIGPSGVGKSTFCKAYQEVSSLPWCNQSQILGLQLTKSETEIESNIHWKLINKKFEYVDSLDLNEFRKVKLMNYFTQIVYLDLFLIHRENPSYFLLDEGICHNFAKELLDLDDTDFQSFMNGRALVYVHTNKPDLVAHRIQQRARETGLTVTHHLGLDQIALANIAKRSLHFFGKLTERLQAFGILHCLLDAEYSIKEAQKFCIEFEQKLFASTKSQSGS